jgi:hypothetical protein
MKIRPVGAGCSVRTDGKTDRHDEANSRFSHFFFRTRLKRTLYVETTSVRLSAYALISNLVSATKTYVACSQWFSLLSAKTAALVQIISKRLPYMIIKN